MSISIVPVACSAYGMASSRSPPKALRCHTSNGSRQKDGLPKTARDFMDSTVRGVYLLARHALFFYRGVGFFFDAAVETEASRWAAQIMSALALDSHVEVYLGPPDSVVHGA